MLRTKKRRRKKKKKEEEKKQQQQACSGSHVWVSPSWRWRRKNPCCFGLGRSRKTTHKWRESWLGWSQRCREPKAGQKPWDEVTYVLYYRGIKSLSSWTHHRREVAGVEQVSGVEGEKDDGHEGQDEVIEGDVHRCLTAPVRWRYETRDAQSWATLYLQRGQNPQNKTQKWREICKKCDCVARCSHCTRQRFFFPSKSFVEKMNLFLSPWLTGYLSVSSVVHCKICRHSSCQHSQYDRLYVHQRVGCSIRDLLMGITKGKFSVLETTSVIWLYIGQRHSHIQRVWSTFGSARFHSDLLEEHCSVYWQSWAGSEQSCC